MATLNDTRISATFINAELWSIDFGNAFHQFRCQIFDKFAPHFPFIGGTVLESDLFNEFNVLHALLVSLPSSPDGGEINFAMMFLAPLDLASVFFFDDDDLFFVLLDELLSRDDEDAFDVFHNVLFKPTFDGREKEFDLPALKKLDLESAHDGFEEVFTAFDNNNPVSVGLADGQKFEQSGGDLDDFDFGFAFGLDNAFRFDNFNRTAFFDDISVLIAISTAVAVISRFGSVIISRFVGLRFRVRRLGREGRWILLLPRTRGRSRYKWRSSSSFR